MVCRQSGVGSGSVKMCSVLVLMLLVVARVSITAARECRSEDVHFEMMTGYVYSAPTEIMATSPGVLLLKDCIEQCRQNSSCRAINFETGLCVLFSGNYIDQSDALTKSQFPVFTIFAQKTCIRATCTRSWVFEVVRGHELRTYIRRRRRVGSRRECMEICLQEHEFTCRSANFNQETGDCAMSDMDRFTVSGLNSLSPEENVDYIESNCVTDPLKMCDFTQLKDRILKTVDSIQQEVPSIDDCRRLCLQSSDFRCHTFDYGDTGKGVCRLSHHATPSLQHIEEPYLELDAATTYQLTACYNVTVDCRASDMVARIRTNKVFNGKVYAKNRPNSCVADVVNDLEFDLRLGYHDLNCDVKQDALGRFSTDIIIQHHDQIVTSQDVGLSVRCSYNLQNRSVGHGVELQVSGEPEENEENAFVVSPTVTMRITNRQGEDIHTAQVGDALSLRFNILDENTPYQIFVRELVALDGVDSSEILLIDSLGCPTDPTIMGAITAVDEATRSLQAPFDAFKFPTSDVVQFKALVTPCLPSCEPVLCDVEDYYGIERRVDSYGKRRKRREIGSTKDDDMLLVQSIRIADKFQFTEDGEDIRAGSTENKAERHFCMNFLGLAAAATIFLCTQVLLAMVCLWQRKWRSDAAPYHHDKQRLY